MTLDKAKADLRGQLALVLEQSRDALRGILEDADPFYNDLKDLFVDRKRNTVDSALARILTLCETAESLRSLAREARAVNYSLQLLEDSTS